MRGHGLWNPALVRELTRLGHGETVVLADAGLPVPAHVPTIDLLWSRGQPKLAPVLRAVLNELVVERATVADELDQAPYASELLGELQGLPVQRTPHERFKELVAKTRVAVRTGEDTAYVNVILHAGVVF